MKICALGYKNVEGCVNIPRSKPHMQRALVLALLSDSETAIKYPSWSSETKNLLAGLQQFGLVILKQTDDELILKGCGRNLRTPSSPVFIDGSGNMCRIAIALSLLVTEEITISGNPSMVGRPLTPFLDELKKCGLEYEFRHDENGFNLAVKGAGRIDSKLFIDGTETSQFITAVLLVAPLFDNDVEIIVTGDKVVSKPYIDLTIEVMRRFNAEIEETMDGFVVIPGEYRSQNVIVPSDFTSLSYIMALIIVTKDVRITVTEFQPSLMQSEKIFLDTMREFGLEFKYDRDRQELCVKKGKTSVSKNIVDARNIPTVVPTLIAMAPFVKGSVHLHGAAHIENHKTKRISVMLEEMEKLGFSFTPHYDSRGLLDGFFTHGIQKLTGGTSVTSKGDHRNFMSLFIASLGTENPVTIEGEELIHASYPDFLENVKNLQLIDLR